MRWFGTSRPSALDYAVRRVEGIARRVPAHVLYVERQKLVRALAEEARTADVVHLAGWGTAHLAARVRPVPAVHYAVDPWADSWRNRRLPRWRRLADVGQKRAVARHERRWYPLAASVVVVTRADADALQQRIPDAHFVAVPNGVEAGPPPLPPPTRPVIGFHGAFETQANVDGARALVRDIFPLVREKVPDAQVLLVGREPTPEVRSLAGPGVVVRGEVPDMREQLDAMSVHVTWMPSGLGMKNKVLEAMAAGRPVVANDRGASGIGAGDGLEVASDPADAAARVIRLLQDPQALTAAGAAARRRVQAEFTWAASAASIERLWEQAAR